MKAEKARQHDISAKIPPTLADVYADPVYEQLPKKEQRRKLSRMRAIEREMIGQLWADAGNLSQKQISARVRPYVRMRETRTPPSMEFENLVIEWLQLRNEIVNSNCRFAISFVKGYMCDAYEFEEAVQSGIEGLFRAAELYEPKRNYVFQTYAGYWIRQSIGRTLKTIRPKLRIPLYMLEHIAALRGMQADPESMTIEQVAQLRGTSFVQAELILKTMRYENLMVELDSSLEGEDGERGETKQKFVKDPSAGTIEDDVDLSLLCDWMKQLLWSKKLSAQLTDTERLVVELRFGITTGYSLKLRECAQWLFEHGHTLPRKYGGVYTHKPLTREGVRQILKKAMTKIKEFVTSEHGQEGGRSFL